MAYSHLSLSRSQSSVILKDDAPLNLPVLQAPEISSVYSLFDDDKYHRSTGTVPDQHSTVTTQFLTTQFLTVMPRSYYPMQQSAPFSGFYGQQFVPNFPFNMYYNR